MAGLSLFVLVLAGAVTWLVVDDDRIEADLGGDRPGGPVATEEDREAQAVGLLDDLQRAVRDRDVEAAAGLAAVPAARRQLTALVENADRLSVDDFSLRYVDEDTGRRTATRWLVVADTRWSFRGFDGSPVMTEVAVRFAEGSDGPGIAGLGGGAQRSPLWMTDTVRVRRTADTLVVTADNQDAERYGGLAARAQRQVAAVLGADVRPLVVEVPADRRALRAQLAAEPGEYDAIAAVTTTVDGSLTTSAPEHVFVNPEVFGGLRPVGAQVVMTHEATHVATGGAKDTVPLWLLEGFADYVALRDVDLPLSRTAGQVLRQVRRDGVPDQLPGSAEFDTRDKHLGAAYESAWLACRVLAEEGGQDALVELYRSVSAGADLDATLRARFGYGVGGLTARWQDELRSLARGEAG